MQPEECAPALGVVVGDAHADGRTDAREAVDHEPEQGAIALAHHRPHINRVEQFAGFLGGQHRGLAGLHHVLRAAHRAGRIKGHDLTHDQPVEEHAQRR